MRYEVLKKLLTLRLHERNANDIRIIANVLLDFKFFVE
jgi:hypothetical protein